MVKVVHQIIAFGSALNHTSQHAMNTLLAATAGTLMSAI